MSRWPNRVDHNTADHIVDAIHVPEKVDQRSGWERSADTVDKADVEAYDMGKIGHSADTAVDGRIGEEASVAVDILDNLEMAVGAAWEPENLCPVEMQSSHASDPDIPSVVA